MGDMAKNFSRIEFLCPCCKRDGIHPELVSTLQELRDNVAVPIHVNSSYRCPRHNRLVGGVRNSEHVLGLAADIVIAGMTAREMYHAAEKVKGFMDGGIGIYEPFDTVGGGFVHVDVRDSGLARWAEMGGKYVGIGEVIKDGE